MNKEEQEVVRHTFTNILEPALVEELVANALLQQVPEGKEIIKPGDQIKFFQLVISGTVKIMRPSEDGGDMFMYYLTSEEACAMSITCCMTSRRSEISAVAEEDCVLLLVPIRYIDKWMIEYPTWKSLIFKTYQNRFNDLLLALDSIAFLKVDERLLDYLEKKTRVLKSNIITVTHEEIALALNTSREVISRLLKKLEKMGKVKLGRNRIEVLNTKV